MLKRLDAGWWLVHGELGGFTMEDEKRLCGVF